MAFRPRRVLTSHSAAKNRSHSTPEFSRHHHTFAACWLWQSVTLKPSSEDNLHKLPLMVLPLPCLRLAKQLHFHADLLYPTASLPSCSDIKRSVYPLVSLSNPWAQPRDTS